MRIRCAIVFIVGALVGFASLVPAGAVRERAAWGQLPSANNGSLANELAGISVVAPTDAWAVGRYNSGRAPTVTGRDTLALHWNGTTWAAVATPNPDWAGADYFTLDDVVATSATTVWAVGYAEDFASLKSTTLVEQWNGVEWAIVPTPNPGGASSPNKLFAVAAASRNDIWAVGEAGFPGRSLILRYRGGRWHIVANQCGGSLDGVDAVSPTDVWAVGPNTTCHFDGTRWSVVDSPQPRGQYSEIDYLLQDVSAHGPDDVWAAGLRIIEVDEHFVYDAIVEHWDGTAWTLTTSVSGQSLSGIEARAANDVWAVGGDGTRNVVVHFDGSGWHLVPSPTPGDSGALADIASARGGHLWAAGTANQKTEVLEAPSRFEGTVVGHTGVSGATVSWFGADKGTTQTDPSGAFAIAGLASGRYRLIATAAGCTPQSSRVDVIAGRTVTKDLSLSC